MVLFYLKELKINDCFASNYIEKESAVFIKQILHKMFRKTSIISIIAFNVQQINNILTANL